MRRHDSAEPVWREPVTRDGDPLAFLERELEALRCEGRLRLRSQARLRMGIEGRLNLCSNDYLGYVATGRLARAARGVVDEQDPGAGASRLVFGERAAHRNLERAIAGWLGTEDALVFTSGYAANVGTISALVGRDDIVVSDALNHASIIDGCRLARARVVVVPHGDIDAARTALQQPTKGRRWLVSESYFSMDGDGPDIAALRRVCDQFGAALVLDEAHAVGVYGPKGRGRAGEASVVPDVWVGTLGKALGAAGAFVAGSDSLCAWLWNRARSFVYSTGASPWICSVAECAVGLAQGDDEGRSRLAQQASRLRTELCEAGVPVRSGFGPIVPVLLGPDRLAVEWAKRLGEYGIEVQAIRPPTVPEGSARLRVTVNAALTDGERRRAVEAFARVRWECGVG